MIQTREILSSAIAATGTAVSTLRAGGTFQVSVTGSGAISASVVIEASMYGGQWITLATVKLAGYDAATDGFVHGAAWCMYRARLTQISGTEALVTVNMGGEN